MREEDQGNKAGFPFANLICFRGRQSVFFQAEEEGEGEEAHSGGLLGEGEKLVSIVSLLLLLLFLFVDGDNVAPFIIPLV